MAAAKMLCQGIVLAVLLSSCWIGFSQAEYDISRCPDVAINVRHYLATFKDTCYVFIDNEKFWTDARDNCWWLGGELVHIHDMDTMNFLKSVLDSKELGWHKNGVWIGASDSAKEGHWIWTTGEEVTWTYWASDQPKNMFFFIEDCAQMRRKDDWHWYDYGCNLAMYYHNSICQFPLKEKGWEEAAPQSAPSDNPSMSDGNVIGIVVGLAIAVIVVMILIMLYYIRWLRKKYIAKEPAVLFQNTFYAQIKNDADGGAATTGPEQVTNNTYWNTNDMNVLYEEVSKQVNHGVNDMENGAVGNADKACSVQEGATAAPAGSDKVDKGTIKTHSVKLMNNEIHPESEPKAVNENLYEDMDALKK